MGVLFPKKNPRCVDQGGQPESRRIREHLRHPAKRHLVSRRPAVSTDQCLTIKISCPPPVTRCLANAQFTSDVISNLSRFCHEVGRLDSTANIDGMMAKIVQMFRDPSDVELHEHLAVSKPVAAQLHVGNRAAYRLKSCPL